MRRLIMDDDAQRRRERRDEAVGAFLGRGGRARPTGAAGMEAIDRALRTRRNADYVETFSKLDPSMRRSGARSIELDDGLRELRRAPTEEERAERLREEAFGEVRTIVDGQFTGVPDLVEAELLGIVAKCYIDRTYDVHILDWAHRIVEHFHFGEPLPAELEKARTLARNELYAFVEVYPDRCCAVSQAGVVSVVMD